MDKFFYAITELNVNGDDENTTEYIQSSKKLNIDDLTELRDILKSVKKPILNEDGDTAIIVETAIQTYNSRHATDLALCTPPISGCIEF